MKRKTFRRISAIFLTTAMVFGMITVMTVTTSANSWNVTIPQRLYNARTSYTIPTNISINAGDTLRIALGIGAIGPNTEVGIVNMSNNVYTRLASSTTPNLSGTFTINTAGTYRIRITNNSNNQANINGYYRYTRELNARIIYSSNQNDWDLRRVSNNATSAFESTFSIKFNWGTVEEDDVILERARAAGCGQWGGICNPTTLLNPFGCGLESRCHLDHHKGAGRLIRRLPTYNGYTVGIVAHAICNTGESEHRKVSGLVDRRAEVRNPVVSVYDANDAARAVTIQHELSHSLGIRGHCDDSSLKCVMKDNSRHPSLEFNKWCTSCMLDIFRFKAGLQ